MSTSATPPHGADPAGSADAAAPSLIASVQSLLHELPGLVSDRVELLSLELHRAGLALAMIAVLGVAAAILGATAWLALWAVIVAGLVALDMPLLAALGLVLLLNIGAAVFAVVRIQALLKRLTLPATKRHLTFGDLTAATKTAHLDSPHEGQGGRDVHVPA